MKLIYTDDGSVTLHNDEYNEAYHSWGGALLESQQIYFEGCHVLEKARSKNQISVLDIGFGLGYNAFYTIYEIRRKAPQCFFKIISLEKDPGILSFSDYPEEIKSIACEIKKNWKKMDHQYLYQTQNLEFRLLIGDARKSLQSISSTFDVVYLDPFSPQKNPELWTEDFFKLLYRRIEMDGFLATYSISTPVLVGLINAGFHPYLIDAPKKKRYATIASPKKIGDLPEKFEKKLETSPERLPFRDPNLDLEPVNIMTLRGQRKTKFNTYQIPKNKNHE